MCLRSVKEIISSLSTTEHIQSYQDFLGISINMMNETTSHS